MIWKVAHLLSWVFFFFPIPVIRVALRLLDVFDGRLGAFCRYVLLKRKLAHCGNRVYLGPWIYIDHFRKLKIGNNVSVHHGCSFLAGGGISIADDVSIAHQCSFVSGSHTWTDKSIPIRENNVHLAGIEIGEDCWVGCNVRVLSGVRIGTRTIIAAGSVVTKSYPCNSLIGGVPSKLIKNI